MGYSAEDEALIKEKWDDLLLSCTKICRNDEDWNFIKRAFFLAKEAHEGVRRRSGEPYMLHRAENRLDGRRTHEDVWGIQCRHLGTGGIFP